MSRHFNDEEGMTREEIEGIKWDIKRHQDKNIWLKSIIDFKKGDLEYKLHNIEQIINTLVEATIPYSFPNRDEFVKQKITAILVVAKREHEKGESEFFLSGGDKLKYIISHNRDEDGKIEDISGHLRVGIVQSKVLDICVRTLGEKNTYVSKSLDELTSFLNHNTDKINSLKQSFRYQNQSEGVSPDSFKRAFSKQ